MADVIKVEQESLAALQNKIYKIPFAARDAVQLAELTITQIQMRLESRRAACAEALARAEAALAVCRSIPADENGYRPSCYNEELAVERAAMQLHIVEGAIRDVNQAQAQHRAASERMLSFAEGPLAQARAELAQKIKLLETYRNDISAAANLSLRKQNPPGGSSGFGGGKEAGPESHEGFKEGKEF
ncbi:MAG TPA: hypothetical protein VFD70_27070 [Anaerolineae bacterium]|nr:hypothetical protein [Anaerolineae bacterium]